MDRTHVDRGLALICDRAGTVTAILRDDFASFAQTAVGRSFVYLVDRASLEKALSFLVELNQAGTVAAWELNLPQAQDLVTIRFAGVRQDDKLLIIGAATDDELMQLYADLSRINNEQMTALRLAMKLQYQPCPSPDSSFAEYYEDLTRLNNELVNLQRQLTHKNRELQRLNTQKDLFLGMVAHDMRNSLNVIGIYSEYLLEADNGQFDPEHRRFITEIAEMSRFLSSVVNQLLDVAAIESGKLHLDRELTDMGALIEQNVALNAILASAKDIVLRIDRAPELPPVDVDRNKIQQVLNNLLGNAIKFSPPGASVDVAVTHDVDTLSVAVVDRGRGIPAAELSALFHPFSLTSIRPTGGESRTGLGLAITRRIVEGHGGRLSVTSTVGEGSTFTFVLPLMQDAPLPTEDPAGRSSPPPVVPLPLTDFQLEPAPSPLPGRVRPCSVLLAEDNLPHQKIALYMLRELGCDSEAVDTGVKVLEALQRRRFDLVLMDVRMPEMDGIEATRRLRRELPREAQPIVYALTAGIAQDEIQLCLDAGMDGFLSKPLVRAELAALCNRSWS